VDLSRCMWRAKRNSREEEGGAHGVSVASLGICFVLIGTSFARHSALKNALISERGRGLGSARK
jgi:hypothetical protein